MSAFYPTDLDFLLRNLDVRTVVLNGGFTDCCILNAAFDASNLGYNLVVLRDLVRGTNQEMEDAALKIVSLTSVWSSNWPISSTAGGTKDRSLRQTNRVVAGRWAMHLE